VTAKPSITTTFPPLEPLRTLLKPILLSARVAGVALALGGMATAQLAPQLPLQPVLEFMPNTLDWRVADLNLETAARQLDAARAVAGLNVSGGGRYDYSNRNVGGVNTDGGNLVVSVNASLTVLPWGPAFDAVRTATRGLERAALDRTDARNLIYLNAITLYYSTRTAIQDLELARASEALSATQLKNADAQLKNGVISRDAYLNIQRASEAARVATLTAKNALEITKIGFFNAINQPVRDDVVLVTAPAVLALPQGSVETLLQTALTRRSDALKAKSRVADAEDALANANRDRLLPASSVSLGIGQFAGTTQTGAALNAGLNFQSGVVTSSASLPLVSPALPAGVQVGTTFTLSAQLSLPLLAPSSDARIASAAASLESARAGLESAQRGADLDVRQRYNDALSAAARLGVANIGVQNARLALETAQTRLAAGLNTALDVESAKLAQRQAERDFESAIAAQVIAVYRLQNALGSFAPLGQ
jgi:outer membrane protein